MLEQAAKALAAVFALHGFVNAFLFLVLRVDLGLVHEVGVLERLVVLIRRFHLIQVGLGEKAGVGKEIFVNCAELVDAELRVGDATGAGVATLALVSQGKPVDDIPQHEIAEADDIEPGLGGEVNIVRVEQVALERSDAGIVPDGLAAESGLGVLTVAFENEPEQQADGAVEEPPLRSASESSAAISRSRRDSSE